METELSVSALNACAVQLFLIVGRST